ncbi:MAG TPA: 4-hydroxy-3-methylbut-2-enyl diphosphate reductase [Candidatus Omnitrophota bacterium]|nr:4-hydroxy-3-methylbut-2-enyl diphosphate reductase [Candidatus Omnitrophota bacterium]
MEKPERTVSQKFGLKDTVQPQLEKSYHSPLIDRLRQNGFELKAGRLTIYLAKEFGFCYGVERAIEYAYETRAKFSNRRIFLTGEIIHNPRVNAELQHMNIQFLSGSGGGTVSADALGKEDIVIMPAFGVPVEALRDFQKKGCVIVDTTCGSVMSVWRRVDSYNRDGFTSVIHGKYDHEETRATCSRAFKYLVVKDRSQAEQVCQYIEGFGNRGLFLEVFKKACSAGFDPDHDLEKIGFANQTTMLSRESIEISEMFRGSIIKKHGPDAFKNRFRHFDTICSATQDRQDAVLELGRKKMNLIFVIGGYKSSNTGHLAEIASGFCPAFHVEDASSLVSSEMIRHKKIGAQEILETTSWLPAGEIKVGMTAGASTPNRVIEEVIEKLIQIA